MIRAQSQWEKEQSKAWLFLFNCGCLSHLVLLWANDSQLLFEFGIIIDSIFTLYPCSSSPFRQHPNREIMGWIPCSGNSNTKKKIKKGMKAMEVQDKLVDQIKPNPGIDSYCYCSVIIGKEKKQKKKKKKDLIKI